MVSRVTQTKIIHKRYANWKLMYQHTSLVFTKLFTFHILVLHLGYIVANDMVQAHSTILLLCKMFPMVSQVTQMKIVCKSSALGIDILTFILNVHKTISISYYRFMYRIHDILKHGLGYFHYFSPQRYLSNGFSTDPNGYPMQKLLLQEDDVPTYHFGFRNLLVFHILV